MERKYVIRAELPLDWGAAYYDLAAMVDAGNVRLPSFLVLDFPGAQIPRPQAKAVPIPHRSAPVVHKHKVFAMHSQNAGGIVFVIELKGRALGQGEGVRPIGLQEGFAIFLLEVFDQEAELFEQVLPISLDLLRRNSLLQAIAEGVETLVATSDLLRLVHLGSSFRSSQLSLESFDLLSGGEPGAGDGLLGGGHEDPFSYP